VSINLPLDSLSNGNGEKEKKIQFIYFGLRILTVHSFFVISLPEGFPLYSRRWTIGTKSTKANNSTVETNLLSGLLASIQNMAQYVTSQHVNMVNLKNYRFFYQIDEKNGLLLVFMADPSDSPSRVRKYMSIVNDKFVEMFHEKIVMVHEKATFSSTFFASFDKFIDNLITTLWMGEGTLKAAKAMDVLEIYILFFNTILQQFLTEKTRKAHLPEIQSIFKKHVTKITSLQTMYVHPSGVIYHEAIDSRQIKYQKLRKILSNIFHDFMTLIKQIIPKRTYQTLVFKHLGLLIRTEQSRLKAYSLIGTLMMEIM
ncbi:MAG: hypothetical protein ACFFDP_08985, partial [Promethearchaeota archaeon]